MKLTVFYLINQKKKIMIILVTLRLKMVVVDQVEVLVVLVGQTFQISLRISLETLVGADDLQNEVQIIEAQI